MADFWACVYAEFRALGAWCILHGPEFWLCVAALCGALILAGAAGWYVFWRWPK